MGRPAAPAPHAGGRARQRRCCARGFTLIEILVALAIVAVALAAGMRAVAQSSDAATLLKDRTLALWVAQNRLAAAQLANPWPPLGLREGEAQQARTRFVWRETVDGTPNPGFRKIEITVADPATPDYVLARLVGYLGQAAQP
jgi:general secretion pathway protein I